MSIFDFILRSRNERPVENNDSIVKNERQKTSAEKELELVQSVSSEDMRRLIELPFRFDSPMQYFIKKGGHPFAYIDIDRENKEIAIQELHKLNSYIRESVKISDRIPSNIEIPIQEIMFNEYSKEYGYSRLICSPKTITGRPSKHPLEFLFMTKLYPTQYVESKDGFKPVYHDYATGKVFYVANGLPDKAEVNIWMNGNGYFYKFKTVGGKFLIDKINSSFGEIYSLKK